ncbi:MAG: DUF1501 domain-containing protein [Terrimicrobiaceae bacterium]|nr:DUF1501 domain-containing protein [Terrimicrobiaceae bacterium]
MNPTLHTRRKFLRTAVLGGAVSWTVPAFLERTFFALDAHAADSAIQTVTGRDGTILVVLQLAGGNDGLNTLVPFADDAYHRARPRLGIPADQTLKITDSLGLHPALSGLRGLYDAGRLAVVQGVGYPNPNRSHFRSTEIWQTAVDADRISTTGWLGRYFDSCCEGADPAVGVSIGGQTPQAFASTEPKGISFSRPEQFRFQAGDAAAEEFFRSMNEPSPDATDGASIDMLQGSAVPQGDTLDFLKRTALDAQVSSDKVLEITRKSKAPFSYPGSQISSSLNLVARLIAGGMPTRVYYVSQGGYDTHNNQAGSHERLLRDLDGAVSAFLRDLESQGNLDRVTLMTFSEFGRRVAENGGAGTDHGAAAPLFVAGGAVRPGFYGKMPSLTDLRAGDLVHNVDFRSVYATILENWLAAPSQGILEGKFNKLDFV